MFVSVVPFAYFCLSRLSGKVQKISWCCIYVVPIMIFFVVFDKVSWIDVLLAYVLINIIYENGYLQNDILTTRKEERPTKRISNELEEVICGKIKIIFFVRSIIMLSVCILLYITTNKFDFLCLITASALLQIIFLFFNWYRGKLNIVLIAVMSYLRFYAPLFPFFINMSMTEDLLALFFVYPFCKFVEFFKETKYRTYLISDLIPVVDKFRVVYYIVLSLILIFINVAGDVSTIYSLAVCLYYTLYRCLSYVFILKFDGFRKAVSSGAKSEFRK